MKRKLIMLGAVGLVLLIALAVQLRHTSTAATAVPHQRLDAVFAACVPASVAARDLDLGPTEATRAEVEKTLRYDDMLFREYRLRRANVSVYVAYWGPGGMPTQLVASHTPDRCWVSAGWTCEAMKHQVVLGPSSASRPGEWRQFSAPGGARVQVQFWHLVGGELYDYGLRSNQVPSIWRWWRDAAKQVFRAPGEQYFIRVSSDRPFEELAGDPGWEGIGRALAGLGLGPASHGTNASELTKGAATP